jgi:hypothetical protein
MLITQSNIEEATMPNKQNITSKNGRLENKEEHYQKISTTSYYRERLQGFYKDDEIEDLQDWLENGVGVDGTPYIWGDKSG